MEVFAPWGVLFWPGVCLRIHQAQLALDFPLCALMRSSASEHSGMLSDHLLKLLCEASILIGVMQRKNLSNNPGDFLIKYISLLNVASEAIVIVKV